MPGEGGGRHRHLSRCSARREAGGPRGSAGGALFPVSPVTVRRGVQRNHCPSAKWERRPSPSLTGSERIKCSQEWENAVERYWLCTVVGSPLLPCHASDPVSWAGDSAPFPDPHLPQWGCKPSACLAAPGLPGTYGSMPAQPGSPACHGTLAFYCQSPKGKYPSLVAWTPPVYLPTSLRLLPLSPTLEIQLPTLP